MKAAGDVLDAIGSALQGGSSAPAAQVQDAAASAFRRAHYEIDDARSGRSAAAAGHTSGFGDDPTVADGDADQEDQIIDTGLDPDPGIGAHPSLRIGDHTDIEFQIPDTVADLGGFDVDGDAAEVSLSGGGAGTCSGDDDDIVEDAPDDDDTGSADDSDSPGEPVAALSDAPSAADRYAAAESPFTGKPVTRGDLSAPSPSPRHVAPPDILPAPERDTEASLPERIRDHAAALIARVRCADLRVRVLAIGAVAALLVAVIAVISLSGVRGKPPAPVAAPPTATSDPTPDRLATELTIYQVSSSCQESDPTAPFQPAEGRDPSKAWVCERINGVDGNVLNIVFGRTVVVTEITIVPGFDYVAPDGDDEWDRHRLVSGVTWRMANQMFPQKITPTRTGVKMTFNAVITDQMSMTITSSERPTGAAATGSGAGALGGSEDSADDTTAVSRIIITGYPLEPGR